MAFIPLKLPPGIARPGTVYDARGRWYDANLVRWFDGDMLPVGGWEQLEAPDPVGVGSPVRGMHAWRGQSFDGHLAFGTPCELWHFSGSTLTDITPEGLVCDQADAGVVEGGYGVGPYGEGLYGSGVEGVFMSVEATTWQLDNFGRILVAVSLADGRIYHWDPVAAGPATVVPDSPSQCRGVVVTPERFIVALAPDGNGRRVQWADQESLTDWTPSATNQAGDLDIAGPGQILAGRRSRGETLIWTTADLWSLRYVGGPFVYSLQQVGAACGAISRHAMAVVDGRAIWMGRRGFFVYDGFVQPIPSEVGNFVFENLNRSQASKVAVDVRAQFGEVWWYYPSSGSVENDSYVVYNWRENTWSVGSIERTSGVDQGVFEFPMAADASGRVWIHEIGTEYPASTPDGTPALVPYAESGPVEIGNGDRIMMVRRIVPDERTTGDVELSLIGAPFPGQAETTHGPFDPAQPTDVRVAARQVRLRIDQVNPGWRFGTPRLEVVPGGMR